jgi:glutaredoxin-like protein NrdH
MQDITGAPWGPAPPAAARCAEREEADRGTHQTGRVGTSAAVAAVTGRRDTMQVKVKVFALSTCPYCRMAREYLTDEGVEFDVTEVDKLEGQERSDAVDEVKRLSGGASFPVIVIGDEVIVGYNKPRIKELVGR